MFPLTRRNLEKLINTKIKPQLAGDDAYAVQAQTSGTGYLDKIMRYMESQEDCFIVEANQQTTAQMPQFIIAYTLLENSQFHFSNEIEKLNEMIEALIDFFDVYLWDGTGSKMKGHIPLESYEEYIELKSTAIPNNKTVVENKLVTLGIDPDQYIILDRDMLTTMYQHLYSSNTIQSYAVSLDEFCGMSIEEIINAINKESIKEITLNVCTEEELNFIINLPTIRRVKLNKMSIDGVRRCIEKLQGHHLEIEIEEIKSDVLVTLDISTGFDRIVIRECAALSLLNINPFQSAASFENKIHKLIIGECENLQAAYFDKENVIEWSFDRPLKLVNKEDINLTYFISSEDNTLEILINLNEFIHHYGLNKFKFLYENNMYCLNTLKIYITDNQQISLNHFKEFKKFSIYIDCQIDHLPIIDYAHITSLNIKSNNKLVPLINHETLEEFTLTNGKMAIDWVDIAKLYPRLKKLKLVNVIWDGDLVLPESLIELSITNCEGSFSNNDLSHCKNLENVTFIYDYKWGQLIPKMRDLSNLTFFELKIPEKMEDLSFLDGCMSIDSLHLNNLDNNINEINLSAFPMLSDFKMAGCNVNKLIVSSPLNHLRCISLWAVTIERVTAIENCFPQLAILDLLDSKGNWLNIFSNIQYLKLESYLPFENLKLLVENNTIKRLYFREFKKYTAEQINEILSRLPRLTRLKLEDNNLISDYAFDFQLNPDLVELIVNASADYLSALNFSNPVIKINLKNNKNLKKLEIKYEDFEDDNVKYEIYYLEAVSNLLLLNIQADNVTFHSEENSLLNVKKFRLICDTLKQNKVLRIGDACRQLSLVVNRKSNVDIQSTNQWGNLITANLQGNLDFFQFRHAVAGPMLKSLEIAYDLSQLGKVNNLLKNAAPGLNLFVENKNFLCDLELAEDHLPETSVGNQTTNSEIPPSITILTKSMFSTNVTIGVNTTQAVRTFNSERDFGVQIVGKHPVSEDLIITSPKNVFQYEESTGQVSLAECYRYQPAAIKIENINNEEIVALGNKAQSSIDRYVSIMVLALEVDEEVPLITHHLLIDDFKIYCDDPSAIKIIKAEGWPFYKIKSLKKTAADIKIVIDYPITDLHNQLSQVTDAAFYVQPILPPKMRAKLYDEIENGSQFNELKFLHDSTLSNIDKIKKIDSFCKSFKRNITFFSKKEGTLSGLLELLIEKIGGCKKSSLAAMLLYHYLNIPALLNTNRRHAFLLIMVQVSKNDGAIVNSLRLFDMGGNRINDITPKALFEDVFGSIKTKEHRSIVASNPGEFTTDYWAKISYQSKFDDFVQIKTVDSVSQLLSFATAPLSPLLRIDSKQALIFKDMFAAHLKANSVALENVVYIHAPSDIERRLNSVVLAAGTRIKKQGVLSTVITKGGYLIINLNTFFNKSNPSDVMSMLSLINDPATFRNGYLVSKNLKVIMLHANPASVGKALPLRCVQFIPSANFFSQPNQKNEIDVQDDHASVVNLFGSIYWRELLLGRIKIIKGQPHFEEGALLKALDKNKSLIILNPPNDSQFDILISAIRNNQFNFNGSRKIPAGFQIKIKNQTASVTMKHVSIFIECENFNLAGKKFIPIGQYNLHECVSVDIRHDKEVNTVPGFLNLYDDTKHIFYVIQSFSYHNWQYLLSIIAKDYPNKEFTFVLAPGIEIKDVAKNERIISESGMDESANLIYSNDPNFTADQLTNQLKLQGHRVRPVTLTPEANFSHYFFDHATTESDNQQITLQYHEGDIIQRLKQGEMVVVTGSVTYNHLLMMLPLTMGDKALFFSYHQSEGFKSLPGTLYIIQPLENKPSSLPVAARTVRHTFVDYKHNLEVKHAGTIAKIALFYNFASRWKIADSASPKKPHLSFERLTKMIKNIESSPLHYSNPIKNIFHFDYPKDSHVYAYLNVIAKYIFDRRGKQEVQFDKLNLLVKQFAIRIDDLNSIRKYEWYLLNCFRGAELRAILGEDLNATIELSSRQQLCLNAATLERLHQRLQSVNVSLQQSVTNPHHAKRAKELDLLMKDPDVNVIVLHGDSGSGKSYELEKLRSQGFPLFNATAAQGIDNWFAFSNPSQVPCLIIDKADDLTSGTWDYFEPILKALNLFKIDNRSLNKKIIFTTRSNQSTYQFRHRFLNDHGRIIRYAYEDNDLFSFEIVKTIFNQNTKKLLPYDNCIDKMLNLRKLVIRYEAGYSYSYFDIINLAYRFANLSEKQDNLSAIRDAIIYEYAFHISDEKKREQFINVIHQELGLNKPKPQGIMVNGHYYPAKKALMIKALMHDLELSLKPADQRLHHFHKRIAIIQGESGCGKSTLGEDLLVHFGFRKNLINTEKSLHHITGDNHNLNGIEKILDDAATQNAGCLFDEVNLIPLPGQKSLGHLLEAHLDKAGSSATAPIIATQNSAAEKYGMILPPGLINRAHFVYFDSYTRTELLEIAEQAEIDSPEVFVECYWDYAQKHGANIRTFFTCLNFYSKNKLAMDEEEELAFESNYYKRARLF